MESLASLEHDWAAPACRPRFRLNAALVVSVLLHLMGFALAALWWPEPTVHNVLPSEQWLSVSLAAAPVDTPEPKSPVQPEPAATEASPAPVEKPAVSAVRQAPAVAKSVPTPAAQSRQSARKSISAMIDEAVLEAPAVEPESVQPGSSTVFDPRLRAKIAAARATVSRSVSRGPTSYEKANGATVVDLGDDQCVEVRRDPGADRDIWWTTSCPPGD